MCKLVCNLVPRPIHAIRVSGGGLEPNATAPGMAGNEATSCGLSVAYTKTAQYSTKFTFKLFFLFTLYILNTAFYSLQLVIRVLIMYNNLRV